MRGSEGVRGVRHWVMRPEAIGDWRAKASFIESRRRPVGGEVSNRQLLRGYWNFV